MRFYTLDVFTDTLFGGNPLAVVFGAESLKADRMQAIAAEFNLSETVFVLPAVRRTSTRRVRIFTPRAELAFAGHPTIGTAWLLATKEEHVATVTIGTDSHVPTSFDQGLEAGELVLRRSGFSEITLFSHRIRKNVALTPIEEEA